MTAYFNELTLDNLPQQNCCLLPEFQKVFARLMDVTDSKLKRLIANESGMAGLFDAVAYGGREEQTFVCTFLCPKFQARPDDEFTDSSLDHFKGAEYKLRLESGEKKECQTMGWSCLNRSLTLGLRSSRFWEKLTYEIEEESLDEGESIHEAICVTKESQINDPKVQSRIALMREFEKVPEPIPCTIPPEKKHIKFQEHHGKEILRDFCAQIVRHRFVQGVIDSIAFDSTTNRFVLRCYDDGTVDLRLHWTDVGLGIKVQTVGRDKRQTEMIADILKEKYDRRS